MKISRHLLNQREGQLQKFGSVRPPLCRRRLICRSSMIPDIVQMVHIAGQNFTSLHPVLGYEMYVAPCQGLRCGDLQYLSTLAKPLTAADTQVHDIVLAALALGYLTAPPGILGCIYDYFVTAPLWRMTRGKLISEDDIKLGKKLGEGGFGVTYKAELTDPDTGEVREVVVKQVREYGEAEAWMNERLMTAAPDKFAEFITGFETKKKNKRGTQSALWLVWGFEAGGTLNSYMKSKDFPYNLEKILLGKSLDDLPKGPERAALTYRVILRQFLEAIRLCHQAGIVHRDIKPENCIVSEKERKLKMIDLGAAADLRTGRNYHPQEGLMDGRYAPPQELIMSSQTPVAPPAPVAVLLSPILWRMNRPERFDMYSTGVTMLQMAFSPLRKDDPLIAFNKRLANDWGHDLRKWRAAQESVGEGVYREGFEVLDLENGAGWELLCDLMQFKPQDRPSAGEALSHPWLQQNKVLGSLTNALNRAGHVMDLAMIPDIPEGSPLEGLRDSSTGQLDSGLSEAQLLAEEFHMDPKEAARKVTEAARAASQTNGEREQSATKRWWQKRQNALERELLKKRNDSAKSESGVSYGPGKNGKAGNGKVNGKAVNGKAKKENEAVVLDKKAKFRLW